MTLFQIKEKWGVSLNTARDRIRIMPGAEKKTFGWEIPDVPMPPITSHKALMLLQFTEVYREGGHPNLSRTGLRECDIDPGYRYLADMGYITKPSRTASITSLGRELMRKLSSKKVENTVHAGLQVGIAEVGVEHKNVTE